MRRVDFIITDARNISRNPANPNGSYSISDEEVLRYINDAQDRLQGVISATKSMDKIFEARTAINLVANQENYSIPDRVFMNRDLSLVEVSSDGTLGNYVVLNKVNFFNRDTNTSSYPEGYTKQSGQIYVIPIPSSSTGSLRVQYERELDDLDKRRGTVSVVTGLTSTSFTSITIGTDADETSTPNLSTIDYVCIVDSDGNRKAYNIPVGSYDTGTNVLTPRAGFTFIKAGDSIAVNDYVVFGKWTTTHPNSFLPDNAERYLIHYAAESLLHKDSSTDLVAQNAKMLGIEQDILNSMKAQTFEVQYIPQLNYYEW